jgi:hypothetical protein
VEGSCKQGNETSDPITSGKFSDVLSSSLLKAGGSFTVELVQSDLRVFLIHDLV